MTQARQEPLAKKGSLTLPLAFKTVEGKIIRKLSFIISWTRTITGRGQKGEKEGQQGIINKPSGARREGFSKFKVALSQTRVDGNGKGVAGSDVSGTTWGLGESHSASGEMTDWGEHPGGCLGPAPTRVWLFRCLHWASDSLQLQLPWIRVTERQVTNAWDTLITRFIEKHSQIWMYIRFPITGLFCL